MNEGQNLQKEQMVVENVFGTVTDKRVIYFFGKGWFKGGNREDVPLRHITSVRVDTARNIIGGFILLIVGLVMLEGPTEVAVIGLILMIFSVLFFWGSPVIVINTAGRDINASKGWPWQKKLAEDFVKALHSQLFRE